MTWLRFARDWFKPTQSDKPNSGAKNTYWEPVNVVMDTCAITAAMFGGRSKKILQAWHDGQCRFFYSAPVEREYRHILLKIPPIRQKAQRFMNTLKTNKHTEKVVKPPNVVANIEDPDDIKFLACAVGGNVDFLVTLDNHLLKLKNYEGIKIVRPAEFLRQTKSIIQFRNASKTA